MKRKRKNGFVPAATAEAGAWMSVRRSSCAVLLAGAGVAATVAVPGTSGAEPGKHDRADTGGLVAEIRKATEQFRDVNVALEAGYRPVNSCETTSAGSMGLHYFNPGLAAPGPVDPAKPEVLLYAPDRTGTLQLLGVEYFQPDVGQGTPSLGGELFDGPMAGHAPGMPTHYDLHVWTEVANPAGVFEAFNPNVTC